MARGKYDSFEEYRKKIIRTAKYLGYDDEVIEKLKNAVGVNQLSTIMTNARKKKIGNKK